jgi:glycosyltransferase involved in cell wall biosynthesis
MDLIHQSERRKRLIIGMDMRTSYYMGGGVGRYHVKLYEGLREKGLEVIPLFIKQRNRFGKISKLENYLSRRLALKRHDIDIFHTSNFDISADAGEKAIITVHDLAYKLFKDIMPPIERKYLIHASKRALSRCKLIISVSEKTKEDIVESLGIDESKIFVIYHGADHLPEIGEEISRKNRSGILFIGTIEPRKNIGKLLDSYKNTMLEYGVNEKLILVGKKGYRAGEIYEKVRNDKILRENVIFKGHIDDAQLVMEYKKAIMLVLPSLYEGFGIPMIEAMRFGCPVVASSRGALREIGREAAIYIDPYSKDDMSEKIARLIFDEKLQQELADKGRIRAKEFCWDKTAEETIRLYSMFLENGR